MGVAAVGALIGGGAIEAGIAIETVAMVSTVTSVVGAITGNQTLAKLGMGAGLGAGIANWAAGSYGVGTDAALEGAGWTQAPAPVGDPAVSAATGDAAASVGVGQSVGVGDTIAGSVNPATGEWTSTLGDLTTDPTANLGGSVAQSGNQFGGSLAPNPSADVTAATGTPDLTAQVNAATGVPQGGIQGPLIGLDQPSIDALRKAAQSGSSGVIDYLNKNAGARSLLQLGGGALGGMLQGWSESEKLALAQAQEKFKQQQYNTAIRNANSPATITFANPGGLVSTAAPAAASSVVAPVTNPITKGA